MSEEDKLALINNSATIEYKLKKGNTEFTTDQIIETKYEDFRYVDGDSIMIGHFVARRLTGSIMKKGFYYPDLENTTLEVLMGINNGAETHWYSFGTFIVTKSEIDDVSEKTTFEAMDLTKKFNVRFDPTKVTFPCTALDLAKKVCQQCGVELGTLDFTNNDFVVENNQYTENDSCRKVMQDIGKLAYSWVRIGWDDKCYLDYSVPTTSEKYDIMNDNYYTLHTQEEKFGPVNRVVIGMSNVEGENVAIDDGDNVSDYNVCELRILDNNLTYTPALRQKVIQGAKRLFGMEYYPMKLQTTGHPWLIGNEQINVVDMGSNVWNTYPLDRTIDFFGHIKTNIEAKAETKVQTTLPNLNTMSKLLTETSITVDKGKKQIEGIVQETIELNKSVNDNNNELKQLQTKFTQNSTSVNVSISELTQLVNNNSNNFQNSIDSINGTLENGVEKLKNTLVTIDIEGIKVSANYSQISTLMSNKEFAIRTSAGKVLAFVGYDEKLGKTVAQMDNLTITNYFTSGYHRQEKMKGKRRTGFFYIRGDL